MVENKEDVISQHLERKGNRSRTCPAKESANLETLFDSGTTYVHHALVVFDAVTQDLDYVRFEEEASTDDIADESTWEFFQLLLPWDVWIPHAATLSKREIHFAREDSGEREGMSSGLEQVRHERRRSTTPQRCALHQVVREAEPEALTSRLSQSIPSLSTHLNKASSGVRSVTLPQGEMLNQILTRPSQIINRERRIQGTML